MEKIFTETAQNISNAEILLSRPNILDEWWQRIHGAYSEPQRYYHTTEHIRAMCSLLESVPAVLVQDRPTVLMAIFFHDIVYDPKASGGDNELQSILAWEEFTRDLGISTQFKENVSSLIRATIKHAIPDPPAPSDLSLFLDLDLEVLGREQGAYAAYASNIRQEYVHYPLEAYCQGRTKVLEHLSKGEVYFTDYWRSHLADKARENMQWEMRILQQGRIPSADDIESM